MNNGIKIYFLNCFLLILPILAWNLALTNQLPLPFKPEVFEQSIPWFITLGENTFRTLIFLLTALMPLSITSTEQKRGLILYLIGILLYFLSWLALIYFPTSAWSNSRLGFLAPAYTPLLWLTGIGLITNRFYFKLPFKQWIFMIGTLLFILFHTSHTLIIYNRIQEGL